MLQMPTGDFYQIKDLIFEVNNSLNALEKNLGDTKQK